MTAPQDLPYTITGHELVAETPGMGVQLLTLGDGERVPWHYHNTVFDILVCVEGTTIIGIRAPHAHHELAPGEHCAVPPMTAHEVRSKDTDGCGYAIIKGVGEHDFNLIKGAVAENEA